MPSCIYTQEDEKQDGEPPERRTAIAEEGQGDTDNRREAKYHSHVDKHMEQEDT